VEEKRDNDVEMQSRGRTGREVNYRQRAHQKQVPHVPIDRPLRELDVERHLSDPALRQSYVTPMFDLIAPKYDAFTRVFSVGMDRGWKSELIGKARDSIARDGFVADVATGTGDLAYALAAARPDLMIAAADVSTRMLALARDRKESQDVSIWGGDMSALPFASSSVDAVTAGYALRNTPDWRLSIAELARVTRPGGHLFTLDFYLPESRIWRSAFLGWLDVAGRAVGWWWHREPMAYGYIAQSIAYFTTAREFAAHLEVSGFMVKETRLKLGGGIALHHAQRR
jgi:demethylmenaquinone methyltransferase/2-methoxy-6-polyprenyl-1,4-benzoquinol methylase